MHPELLRAIYGLRATQLRAMSAATQHRRIVTVTTETLDAKNHYIAIVSELVSAYVSNNHVAAADLPALIANVHGSLSSLITSVAPEPTPAAHEKPTAAQVRKSVTRDALISFLDGKGYKTLKRHLTVHGLTPDTYRAQFGLPADYPMVAAAYSEVRSSLAKSLGLGAPINRSIKGGKVAA